MSGVDLPDGTSEIFFALGLDDPNQLESAGEISVCAHAISLPAARVSQVDPNQIGHLICPSRANQFARVTAPARNRASRDRFGDPASPSISAPF
jgi:hypothetical protein